ncbi:isoprenoid synthase domain-containing protein [Lyophyllum atratum]|nr:isoprenoid synthase domain-containing protein [Lyophyllum atratum]
MLVLSTLHNLLSQVLSLPQLHTAVLLTPTGQLVSVAADPQRPKDEIRVIVGLAMEIWQETKEQDFSMVDSELGRILVVPVDENPASSEARQAEGKDYQPLMLLALNSTADVDWEVLQTKGVPRCPATSVPGNLDDISPSPLKLKIDALVIVINPGTVKITRDPLSLFFALADGGRDVLGAMRTCTGASLRNVLSFQNHAVTRTSQPSKSARIRMHVVAPELSHLRASLLGLLGSAHPGLSEIARYYFLQPSQQLRSLLVLLFSHATNGLGRNWPEKEWSATSEVETGLLEELDRPLKLPDVLNNWHPSMPNKTASFSSVFDLRPPGLYQAPPLSPSSSSRTLRLAQIVEMIHIASVLHDDVQDNTAPHTEPDGLGNKLSILAGDFLLGRASAALSRLGESEVVELVAGVISNLAEGEMLRVEGARSPSLGQIGPKRLTDAWDIYLRKTYLKTASLMAKSARAAVVLGGCREGEVWKDVAYAYGRNLGIAYQLVEDTLEYESGGENLTPGLVTGPVLFAGEEHPDLQPLIHRNLAEEGDIERAVDFVSRSNGIERTRRLAQSYADNAREVLQLLPDSETKIALDVLAEGTVSRTW